MWIEAINIVVAVLLAELLGNFAELFIHAFMKQINYRRLMHI